MLTVGDQVTPPLEVSGGWGGKDLRSPDLEGGRQRSEHWGIQSMPGALRRTRGRGREADSLLTTGKRVRKALGIMGCGCLDTVVVTRAYHGRE